MYIYYQIDLRGMLLLGTSLLEGNLDVLNGLQSLEVIGTKEMSKSMSDFYLI